jgi:iron complex transport system substrate-binding protein
MKIASLVPFATDILTRFGIGADLVAVTHLCEVPKSCGRVSVVTEPCSDQSTFREDDEGKLLRGLTQYKLDIKQLLLSEPELLLSDLQVEEKEGFISWAESYLEARSGRRVRIFDASISSLSEMSRVVEEIGGLAGDRLQARALANKTQAQLMAWADSFFERCKGKRVVVLSSVEPLVVAERWLPDIVRLLGAKSLERGELEVHHVFSWNDVVAARPDVILVAPEGFELAQSVKTLSTLQSLPDWESMPAVKRGEVVFCAGIDLYRPGPRFLRGAAALVSAIANLDSGYITERDTYFKVRYLELHRHRFL